LAGIILKNVKKEVLGEEAVDAVLGELKPNVEVKPKVAAKPKVEIKPKVEVKVKAKKIANAKTETTKTSLFVKNKR
jgi:hypothetical protein